MDFVFLDSGSVLFQIQCRLGIEIWEDPNIRARGEFNYSREDGYAYIVVRDSAYVPTIMHELVHAMQFLPSTSDEDASFLFKREMFETSGIEEYFSSRSLPYDRKRLSMARYCLDRCVEKGEWYSYSDYPVEYLPFYFSNPWVIGVPIGAEEILLEMLADVEPLLHHPESLYSKNQRKLNLDLLQRVRENQQKIVAEVKKEKIRKFLNFLKAAAIAALLLL